MICYWKQLKLKKLNINSDIKKSNNYFYSIQFLLFLLLLLASSQCLSLNNTQCNLASYPNYSKRFLFDSISPIKTCQNGSALPKEFFIKPGQYLFYGCSYEMRTPGIYFLFDPITFKTTRRAVKSHDPLEMASMLSWVTVHGGGDNNKSYTQLNTAAKNRFISLTCGAIAQWITYTLNHFGMTVRIVRFLTMNSPNNFSDGHVAVELKINDVWTLIDADLGRYYQYSDGKNLSAYEFVQAAPAWKFKIKQLKNLFSIDSSSKQNHLKQFDYATIIWTYLGTDEMRKEWTQSVSQAVGIEAPDGYTYWLLPEKAKERKSWVENLSPLWKVEPNKEVWLNRFY